MYRSSNQKKAPSSLVDKIIHVQYNFVHDADLIEKLAEALIVSKVNGTSFRHRLREYESD